MNRDGALAAVDAAFADGIKHLYDVFVEGLEIGTPANTLALRFRKGLAFHLEAQAKTRDAVIEYFAELRP
jgi:hypothetical protein